MHCINYIYQTFAFSFVRSFYFRFLSTLKNTVWAIIRSFCCNIKSLEKLYPYCKFNETVFLQHKFICTKVKWILDTTMTIYFLVYCNFSNAGVTKIWKILVLRLSEIACGLSITSKIFKWKDAKTGEPGLSGRQRSLFITTSSTIVWPLAAFSVQRIHQNTLLRPITWKLKRSIN